MKEVLRSAFHPFLNVFLTETLLSLSPMTDRIIYKECPSCKSANISKTFLVKDFTVSDEDFEIWQCNYCTLRFTQNIPGENSIGNYYKSGDYISHSDTKKGFVNRAYHFVRNHTLRSKKSLIENISEHVPGSLLDVGAGTGAFANIMKESGWSVIALEPDETARKNASANYELEVKEISELFLLKENSFDVITMWHVLEHVHDLHEYLDTFFKLLRPKGLLMIAVPNYTSFDARHYKEFWAAYDVPRHLYHFSPDAMKEILQLHQFRVFVREPMWFDSFYVSMLSEKYLSGKTNFLKAIWNGFQSNIYAASDAKKASSIIYFAKKNPDLI